MFRFTTRIMMLAVALVALAGLAAAQDRGPQSGLTSSSELNMTATVDNALRIDIETSPGGVTVNGTVPTTTGVFSLDLGRVNGLGVGTPSAGVTATAKTGGVLYSTPIKVTPYFAGLGAGVSLNNGTLTVQLDPTVGAPNSLVVAREGTAPASMDTPLTAAPTVVTTSAQNGQAITRHVGMFIPVAGTVGGNQTLNVRVVYRIMPLGL